MRKTIVPIGDTAPNPYSVLDSFSQWGSPKFGSAALLRHADSHFWKHTSKSLVMKYCHISNHVSFPKQAISFHGLHSSTSKSMTLFTDVPSPSQHVSWAEVCVQYQSGMAKLLLRLLREYILKFFSLSYAALSSWLESEPVHDTPAPLARKSNTLITISSDTEKWKSVQNFSDFYTIGHLANTFLVDEKYRILYQNQER